ncbi:MAG: hypothetical protein ACYTG5_14375 [Planctomycetota bacterium]|jgi:hypothetical protein
MLSESGTRIRTLLFLILLGLWAGWRSVEALPRIFWSQVATSLQQLPETLSPDPAILLIPLALSPEMVALIEAELPEGDELYLYRRRDPGSKSVAFDPEVLDRQVLRCSQYFFPRPVRGIHTETEAEQIIATRKPYFVVDYSPAIDSPFHADYEIAEKFILVQLWRRKSGS